MLTLHSPLSGWCAPLDETPDEVFAQRLLGDGVAIDPTGDTLHAPCDGEIVSVAASKHAVAVRADIGAEILLHVGIDTVALNGEGFEALVQPGERVRQGQPLLKFNLDVLARGAKSLITPMLITNGDRFSIADACVGLAVEVGDALFKVVSEAGDTASASTGGAGQEQALTFVVPLAHGIHARPAAVIANFAKAQATEISVLAHGRTANARSAVSLMALGLKHGDEMTLIANGAGARATLEHLKQLVLGITEAPHAADTPPGDGAKSARSPAAGYSGAQDPAQALGKRGQMGVQDPSQTRAAKEGFAGREANDSPPATSGRLRGVIASRGLAVGRAVTLKAAEIAVVEAGRGIGHESAEFERARDEVRARLNQLAQHSQGAAKDVITAHLEFIDDWELVASARRTISRGKSAAFAWRRAVRDSADTLRSLGDPRMAERVDDLIDLESQVLLALNGEAPTAIPALPERAILVAEDLKPSQLVSLDATKLAGICLAAGGPTSHVAILAAAMGVPALVALGPGALAVEDGAWLVLDAEQGNLSISPDQIALAAAEQTLAQRRQRQQTERAAAHVDCRTADGVRIEVFANLASIAEAQVAVAHGAEGCGLLRTEFLFLERDSAPSEEEQLQQYQGIAGALEGRPLVIRTLDIGGDKPIPYLPLPAEENPALGLRGVRTSLWRPDLLRVQLRAILRVHPVEQCRVLLPMITDPAEIRAVRRMLDEVRRELSINEPVQVGAMVETPSSAVIAARIVREVDFLSIGTNDLTQYTLAMDRGHAELAHRIDGLHPAVLNLIAMTVDAADEQDKLVAVCGGLASEPAAVPILIGLGVRELSVVPTLVPQLKSLIRTLTVEACRSLAQRALSLDTAEAVRALANETMTPARGLLPAQ
ncbi:phosphoenolpyruvate--protein phosphotransferase [Steroidobacter sp. S1-65]|uniref:phosphoenolpyruvate--protein phosphotransferase n=1 Tax=Steroidobacter gossypii TaxID=2805490 RepID=A0ABS1X242_9GAMM|nr:phosphoenolpyruvate--protein phosphotransferase [Steroidobacter gossypii]MBM0107272.1 phosphoenolpyruvate--protein phosphotransferase [Steroidobacter gossypii]